MAYTINRGYSQEHGLDRLQRGLLIGLPAIALILSFGAIRHHSTTSPVGTNAKTIPIVSSLSNSTDKSGSDNKGNNSSGNNTPTASSSANPASSETGQISSLSTSPSSTSGSGFTPIVGGKGGGPTGGTGTSGGGATIPDCSLNQIATVTCQVPACSPAVTLQPGDKAILGVDGTCLIVN
jgi:hypothetical protein